ncbi:hypothetical protein JW756_00040 [Candidatus Woesearchaeota archaeon]|nr:hypothetical protein [Candidatus Woesearchaeota archaeon]
MVKAENNKGQKEVRKVKRKMSDPTRLQEQDLASLISDIKQSYRKSNLEDIDGKIFLETQPEKRIGYFLKNIPNTSNKEFSMNFDPVESIFLQKLVAESTINQRIILRQEDFFKGIVFIDYLTKVLIDDNGFSDELYGLAQEIEKVDPLLDPDMGILVRYAGIYFASNVKKRYFLKPDEIRVNSERKYRLGNTSARDEFTNLKNLDPFYDSLGKKVYSLFQTDEVKSQINNFEGLNDLKALLFIDSILPFLETSKYKEDVVERIGVGDYYNASFKALQYISKEAIANPLEDYIESLRKLVARPAQTSR